MDTFAKRLIMALEERDMKAAELSRQAKIGESSMSQYKNGIHEPKQQKLQRIAETLDVSIPWLMGVVDGPIQPYKNPPVKDEGLEKAEAELLKLFHLIPPESRHMFLGMIEAALKSQGLL